MKVLGAKHQNLSITNPNYLSMKYLADKVVYEYFWDKNAVIINLMCLHIANLCFEYF